ncbi:hypothetical protein [Leptospira kmetyi]|nr:hypothetical protein [Leptospira kmetyi]
MRHTRCAFLEMAWLGVRRWVHCMFHSVATIVWKHFKMLAGTDA